jgi:hypothetical protein
VLVRDWTRTNRNWYDAVQIEKRMMFIILTLIVAVAAFNLVSTLVMTVTDKRADIAILRTLGASPRSIMGIFIVQGAASGCHRHARGWLLGLAWPSTSTSSCRPSSGCWAWPSCPAASTSSAACPASRWRPTSCRWPDQRWLLAFAGHAVPELARQPRQPGRGAAL